MIPSASKATKAINSFIFVPIPSARELFNRYGEQSNKGIYTADSSTVSDLPCLRGSSVIDDCINAQTIVQHQLEKAEGTRH